MNERGFGLVSALMAVAIAGMAGVVIANVMANGNKNHAILNMKSQLSDLRGKVTRTVNCRNTVNAINSCSTNRINLYNNANNVFLSNTGRKFGNWCVRAVCQSGSTGNGLYLQAAAVSGDLCPDQAGFNPSNYRKHPHTKQNLGYNHRTTSASMNPIGVGMFCEAETEASFGGNGNGNPNALNPTQCNPGELMIGYDPQTQQIECRSAAEVLAPLSTPTEGSVLKFQNNQLVFERESISAFADFRFNRFEITGGPMNVQLFFENNADCNIQGVYYLNRQWRNRTTFTNLNLQLSEGDTLHISFYLPGTNSLNQYHQFCLKNPSVQPNAEPYYTPASDNVLIMSTGIHTWEARINDFGDDYDFDDGVMKISFSRP